MSAQAREELLSEVRGLVAARDLIEHGLGERVRAARAAGVDAWCLAGALGLHRSTLYRRYLPPIEGGDPPQAEPPPLVIREYGFRSDESPGQSVDADSEHRN